MTKSELRNGFKQKRKDILLKDVEKLNDLILINFQQIDIPFVTCIHSYIPSLKLREPETATIVRYLRFKNPGLNVVVPRIDNHSGKMDHIRFEEADSLVRNVFGIDEPLNGIKTEEREIDLVLVPLLAFDTKGNRVGYGKGYYDRFLARCNQQTLKIGLSFFEPVDEIDDINPFDISLNYCVTPQKLFIF